MYHPYLPSLYISTRNACLNQAQLIATSGVACVRHFKVPTVPTYLLVSEQKWVDCSGEEEDTRQVDRRSGEDGHYRSDRDRLLRVCQVAGAVRARHNSCQVQRGSRMKVGRLFDWLAGW